MMNAYQLEPVDTLFFRDARPMQAGSGSGGHGARWPLPTILQEALRANLLRKCGIASAGKTITHHKRKKTFHVASDQYRSLHTQGPFPLKNGELYLPAPKDVTCHENVAARMVLGKIDGNNRPVSWLSLPQSILPPSKDKLPEWIPLSWYQKYLAGESLAVPQQADLFDTEERIGTAIDPNTGSVLEGNLYASEHLRLRHDVRLWFMAGTNPNDPKQQEQGSVDDLLQDHITLGGESRMVVVSESKVKDVNLPRPSGRFIKWVLLTHAVFANGWRPNWISEADGQVMLRAGEIRRREGEERKIWRERVRTMPPIRASLMGALVDKPICFSGWDKEWENSNKPNVRGGPKPTMLAVPAGSVYYFEAETDEDAEALVTALHLRNQSDMFGEKGMGLGVCANWKKESEK